MGAVRLGAYTRFGMGKSLGGAGSEMCCCVFELGGALGCKGTFLRGLDDLLSEKEEEWRLVLGEQN